MNKWKSYPNNIPPPSRKEYLVTVKRGDSILTTVAEWYRRVGIKNNVLVATYTWGVYGKVLAFKKLPRPYRPQDRHHRPSLKALK
jgi:hypothetical protein